MFEEVIAEILTASKSYNPGRKCYYIDLACALDCYVSRETSGHSGVYAYGLKAGDAFIIIRTRDELEKAFEVIRSVLSGRRIVFYSANPKRLFHYLKNHKDIPHFSTRDGDILNITLPGGIEIRNYNRIGLSDVPYVVPVSGVFSWTPLTEGEREDIENVADVIAEDIKKRAEKIDKGIGGIPLTITGYTRRALSRAGVRSHLNIKDIDEYSIIKQAYAGGVCVVNPAAKNIEIPAVDSYDLDSSYIAVLLSQKFPCAEPVVMRNGTVDLAQVSGCWIARVIFKNLKLKKGIRVGCIPHARAAFMGNISNIDGYVSAADYCSITIASPLFSVITRVYDYESIACPVMYYYKSDYIPADAMETIITLYAEKEALKGDAARKYEYKQRKAVVSSVYGLCGVDPMTYGSIEAYNKKKGRAVPFQWAPFVTAYAAANLFNGILAVGGSFIYSDTDSIKADRGSADNFVKWYNVGISEKIRRALEARGLLEFRPILESLGTWEKDGEYIRFKTLGAKKYLYEDSVGIHGVISGMKKDFSKRISFDKFHDGAIISERDSGVYKIRQSDEAYITRRADRDGVEGIIEEDGEYMELPSSYRLGHEGDITYMLKERIYDYGN